MDLSRFLYVFFFSNKKLNLFFFRYTINRMSFNYPSHSQLLTNHSLPDGRTYLTNLGNFSFKSQMYTKEVDVEASGSIAVAVLFNRVDGCPFRPLDGVKLLGS